MRVIGTAGHVDHGKSTLVEALTGMHPDRLKEEREREMTIDLGFAWLTLPGGEEVGVVDVPGHRDFIENMLAGVGGIDAVLFVVAADEGVMPQTREHLAILDLLQIRGGVVALTKTDLVEDEEWLELIEADLRQVLHGSILQEAQIVRVSACQRRGLAELLEAIRSCLVGQPPRPDYGRPRLPIDRVFTIAGFGSVVTGTLSEGRLQVGDEVEILPQGLRGRVRGLQTHKRKEDYAVPGSRTAVNISGIALEDIRRGNVLAHPGDYIPTRWLDVRFRLLPDASAALQHNTQVKFFLGAAEIPARLRLLGSEKLEMGHEGWLQLELSEPVVAIRGDRYILRRPSPGETLGGGTIVDPHPDGRHKRFSAEVLARLEVLSHGTADEILLQAILAQGIGTLKDALERSGLAEPAASQAVESLFQAGHLINLEDAPLGCDQLPRMNDLVTSPSAWQRLAGETLRLLQEYHQAFPLRLGMPREELKSRLKGQLPGDHSGHPIPAKTFNLIIHRLVQTGSLAEQGALLHLPGHAICFTAAQQSKVDGLLKRFAANPKATPSPKECQAEVGEDLYQALIDLDELVQVSPEVVFRKEDYLKMVEEVRSLIRQNGSLTAAQARDHFNTSRKYILGLLEHLDAAGVTVREGDVRRLK
jgi:selenocysteine-specific elongation factor